MPKGLQGSSAASLAYSDSMQAWAAEPVSDLQERSSTQKLLAAPAEQQNMHSISCCLLGCCS